MHAKMARSTTSGIRKIVNQKVATRSLDNRLRDLLLDPLLNLAVGMDMQSVEGVIVGIQMVEDNHRPCL